MFQCPHCGQPIEVGPRPQVSWWQYDIGGPRASLGCGTLILIAIIVAMFSGGRSEADAIRALRVDIQALEKKIDSIAVNPVAAPQADPVQNR